MHIDIRNLEPELVEIIEKIKLEKRFCSTNIGATKEAIKEYYSLKETIKNLKKDNEELNFKIKYIEETFERLDIVKNPTKMKEKFIEEQHRNDYRRFN